MREAGLRWKVAGMNHFGLNYLAANQRIAERLAEAELQRRAASLSSRARAPRRIARLLAHRHADETVSRGVRRRTLEGES